MKTQTNLTTLLNALTSGDRDAARRLVREAIDAGMSVASIINDVYFPVYEKIEELFRADQLENVQYHLATRLLRTLIDQTSAHLDIPVSKTKTVFAVCGQSQSEELAAQMAVDLLEASGCHVTFSGGGIPADEILAEVHARRPDVLLMFASAASDLPDIRAVIDQIREIGAVKRTQIIVGGGVFNRAEGLAEEINCDLWAKTPVELIEVVMSGKMKHESVTESKAKTTRRTKSVGSMQIGTQGTGRAAA